MSSGDASSLSWQSQAEQGEQMTTPVPTLDQRYSGATAVATTWDETRQALEDAELFWVSTVRADGRPHVTPVVGAWAEGHLVFHRCRGAEVREPARQRARG